MLSCFPSPGDRPCLLPSLPLSLWHPSLLGLWAELAVSSLSPASLLQSGPQPPSRRSKDAPSRVPEDLSLLNPKMTPAVPFKIRFPSHSLALLPPDLWLPCLPDPQISLGFQTPNPYWPHSHLPPPQTQAATLFPAPLGLLTSSQQLFPDHLCATHTESQVVLFTVWTLPPWQRAEAHPAHHLLLGLKLPPDQAGALSPLGQSTEAAH